MTNLLLLILGASMNDADATDRERTTAGVLLAVGLSGLLRSMGNKLP